MSADIEYIGMVGCDATNSKPSNIAIKYEITSALLERTFFDHGLLIEAIQEHQEMMVDELGEEVSWDRVVRSFINYITTNIRETVNMVVSEHVEKYGEPEFKWGDE